MISTHQAFAQMNRLRDELDRVFGRDQTPWNRSNPRPPVNVWENEQAFFLEAELPGMSIQDLEIYVHDGDQLTIKGNRSTREIENAKPWKRERSFGEFTRTFTLEADVDAQMISASLDLGVLTIKLPKNAAVKPRKIEIQVDAKADESPRCEGE